MPFGSLRNIKFCKKSLSHFSKTNIQCNKEFYQIKNRILTFYPFLLKIALNFYLFTFFDKNFNKTFCYHKFSNEKNADLKFALLLF